MKKFFTAFLLSFTFLALSASAQQNYTLSVDGSNRTNTITPKSDYLSGFSQGLSEAMEFSNLYFSNTNYGNRKFSSYRTNRNNSFLRSFDPYIIEINSVKYVMVKDNNDNIVDEKDLLGITDTISSVFASLRPLDLDGNNKLTGEELNAANIRLVKIDSNGKLLFNDKKSDFDNSNIVFIHLKELRKAYKNNGSTGDFGMFDVVIKDEKGNNKLVTGFVTFETAQDMKKYF